MQTVFPKEWEPLTQLPIKSQEGLLIPKRNITSNQLPIGKKMKVLQRQAHRTSRHYYISETLSWQIQALP